MKVDPDYIKKILQIMKDYNEPTIELKLLKEKIGTQNSEADFLKFFKHIYDLECLNCVECSQEKTKLPLEAGLLTPAGLSLVLYNKYYLTIDGNKLLDIMENDTWWNKVKGTTKEMTIGTLKQAPSMIISTLLASIK